MVGGIGFPQAAMLFMQEGHRHLSIQAMLAQSVVTAFHVAAMLSVAFLSSASLGVHQIRAASLSRVGCVYAMVALTPVSPAALLHDGQGRASSTLCASLRLPGPCLRASFPDRRLHLCGCFRPGLRWPEQRKKISPTPPSLTRPYFIACAGIGDPGGLHHHRHPAHIIFHAVSKGLPFPAWRSYRTAHRPACVMIESMRGSYKIAMPRQWSSRCSPGIVTMMLPGLPARCSLWDRHRSVRPAPAFMPVLVVLIASAAPPQCCSPGLRAGPACLLGLNDLG